MSLNLSSALIYPDLEQILSFFAGLITSNVYNSAYVGVAGCVVTMLAVVPPWPFYNKHPVQWLPARKVGGFWVQQPGIVKKGS
jgi:hypothetical protein